MTGPLKTRADGGVLEVVLDRPKANAIDLATSRLMGETFKRFRDDAALRVAIVTGAGDRFFSAGWDLKAAAAGDAVDGDYGCGGFGGMQELPDLNKPLIAAVNGMAVGGGWELALSCDLILASKTATFALPEIRAGTLADAASIKLPKRIPYHVAMELLLTGRSMDAEEAHRWGVVNEIVEPEALLPNVPGQSRASLPTVRRWSSPPSRKWFAKPKPCVPRKRCAGWANASSPPWIASTTAKISLRVRARSRRSASPTGKDVDP